MHQDNYINLISSGSERATEQKQKQWMSPVGKQSVVIDLTNDDQLGNLTTSAESTYKLTTSPIFDKSHEESKGLTYKSWLEDEVSIVDLTMSSRIENLASLKN